MWDGKIVHGVRILVSDLRVQHRERSIWLRLDETILSAHIRWWTRDAGQALTRMVTSYVPSPVGKKTPFIPAVTDQYAQSMPGLAEKPC